MEQNPLGQIRTVSPALTRARQKRRSNAPIIWSVTIAVVAAAALGVVLLAVDGVKLPGLGSPYQRAVERWLKENLNDPNYEIVKWYEPVSAAGCKSWTGGFSDNDLRSFDTPYWSEVKSAQVAIRLKFRERSPLGGAWFLRDSVFLINDGEVLYTVQSLDFRYPRESYRDMLQRVAR